MTFLKHNWHLLLISIVLTIFYCIVLSYTAHGATLSWQDNEHRPSWRAHEYFNIRHYQPTLPANWAGSHLVVLAPPAKTGAISVQQILVQNSPLTTATFPSFNTWSIIGQVKSPTTTYFIRLTNTQDFFVVEAIQK